MDLGLSGKCVVITGGSKGIGRSTALAFADEGANVAICARGEEALGRTEAEIAAKGVKALGAVCDVADPAALDGFLEDARTALGGIDVLVNNTSGFGMTDDEAGWKASLDVDLLAAVRATWKVVPWMTEGGGGAIINISSTSALEAGSPPAYAAVKAALISHSNTMAIELAPKHIRVNSVAPGSIDFPGGFWATIKSQNKAYYDIIHDTIPSGRFGRPEEVGAAVVFLASERASWITGTTLLVDGGQHKGIF